MTRAPKRSRAATRDPAEALDAARASLAAGDARFRLRVTALKICSWFDGRGWSARLTRDQDGTLSQLDARMGDRIHREKPPEYDRLLAALDRLDPAALTRLQIVARRPTGKERTALERTVGRFSRAAVELVES